ncbi:MAG: alpha/beta hydrolase [Betaproteobacteria bacterium]|nr:alpha/beta hydrolase [Betaproteobacteria bacterium]
MAVYRPTRDLPDPLPAPTPPDERWFVTADSETAAGQRLQLWWLPAASAGGPAALYLHGSFRNLYRNQPKMQALREAGLSVLAVEYRGWGESSPAVPDEAGLLADARRAWRELTRRQPDPKRRLIFGHSLGGAVAVALATVLPRGECAGLILESTFSSLPDLAGHQARPAAWLARAAGFGFDSGKRLGTLSMPLLMLHGEADRTVPIALGRRLFDAAPPNSRFVAFAGGNHSDLHAQAADAYRAALQAFTASLPR